MFKLIMNSLIISLFVEFYKVLIIKSGPSKKDEMEIHNLQDFIHQREIEMVGNLSDLTILRYQNPAWRLP